MMIHLCGVCFECFKSRTAFGAVRFIVDLLAVGVVLFQHCIKRFAPIYFVYSLQIGVKLKLC